MVYRGIIILVLLLGFSCGKRKPVDEGKDKEETLDLQVSSSEGDTLFIVFDRYGEGTWFDEEMVDDDIDYLYIFVGFPDSPDWYGKVSLTYSSDKEDKLMISRDELETRHLVDGNDLTIDQWFVLRYAENNSEFYEHFDRYYSKCFVIFREEYTHRNLSNPEYKFTAYGVTINTSGSE
ncbi:hypothetical protein [Algoriphagus sp. Y33]|uniref:hypothetical protein n=1 Tax=Algoriphagus sp. Y33 TaxID=2772483 RepID=UPI00177A8349|nr:hypothetical protein [Algoriphagus sp. Y33]